MIFSQYFDNISKQFWVIMPGQIRLMAGIHWDWGLIRILKCPDPSECLNKIVGGFLYQREGKENLIQLIFFKYPTSKMFTKTNFQFFSSSTFKRLIQKYTKIQGKSG